MRCNFSYFWKIYYL